ncbi:hypothetical protein ACIPY2_07885 [Paenarthrobacter sp. NPDC089675]|uniref:hypothetical protein n=1 Tax=Paenarthrobacter sp. NPDC089675 TaxID=3364376 RepID=UPI003810B736
MTMTRRLLLPLVLLFVLSGCSANQTGQQADAGTLPSIDRSAYAGVHAQLDKANAVIVMPVDTYEANADESMVITAANMYIIEDCMKKAGFAMPEKHGDLDVKADQSYGIWVPEFAAKYGYERPIVRTIPGIYDSGTRESPQATVKKYFECDTSTSGDQIPAFRSRVAGQDSLLTNIVNDSNAVAERDVAWKTLREAWIKCLGDAGINMREDSPDAWVPSYPADKQGEIRTALQDAECKNRENTMQGLMDIRAQYQTALIAAHQAALNTLADEKAAALGRAKDILRQHGHSGL